MLTCALNLEESALVLTTTYEDLCLALGYPWVVRHVPTSTTTNLVRLTRSLVAESDYYVWTGNLECSDVCIPVAEVQKLIQLQVDPGVRDAISILRKNDDIQAG